MSKAFASQADLADKKISSTQLSANAYAYTAEGDPNTGIVVGDRSVMMPLAFMFESRTTFRPTARAMASDTLDRDYARCWAGLWTKSVRPDQPPRRFS